MKRSQLERVINKHVGQMKKYARQIPGSFVLEDIHELRVEYKKLRAFLRLLHPRRATYDVFIPHKLKALYHAAGEVRDTQLFLSIINTGKELPAPQYVSCLAKQLFDSKEKLVKEIEKMDFDEVKEAIKEHLPGSMRDGTIRKFIHRKVAAIHITLLAVERIDNLHTIRKHLKDIIHNIRIFQSDWGISFPVVAWKSEKFMVDIASRLGDFNDECRALKFLHNGCSNELPVAEQQVIENWRKEREAKREEHKLQVMQQVQQLQLVHNFK